MFRRLLVSLLLCQIARAGSPDAVVVFNEVQYNPPGSSEDGEWVELFNQMGIMTDVSGWRIDGLGYTFPQGTFIEPGEYLVVYKDPPGGELGPFTSSLANNDEPLKLINQSERLMDELSYGDNGRWPVEADGSGATLAKRDPYSANKPSENWNYSEQLGGTPGTTNFPDENAPPTTTTIELFGLDTDWRYNDEGDDLGTGWATDAHAVAGNWKSGTACFGNETGPDHTIRTPFAFPGFNNPFIVTYYFEKDFELSAAQASAIQSLPIRYLVDDGAVFYLNGAEVHRSNLPGGVITAATRASDGIEAELSISIPLPPGTAVAGTNRLSVEVHQTSGISSDILFGAELDLVIEDAAPGSAPPVAINEIPPASEASFWIELANTGTTAVELDSMVLSVGGDPAREFLLPAQSLAAGGLLVLDEATLGFRPTDNENVFLYDASKTIVLDGQQQTDRLRGRAAEKNGAWLFPDSATAGSANVFTFHDEIVISEIAYNPPALSAIPDTPATFDNVELFGFNVDWRYNDGDESLASNWASTAHAVGGNWKSGGAPIGRKIGALTPPLVTDLISSYLPSTVTYYFEREFNLSAQQFADLDSMEITHQIDDGAIFYINGVEHGSFNLASGAGPETTASPDVLTATATTLAISADSLVVGSNRISVEVHQESTVSSDVVFGLKLDARFALTPFVPGAPFRNSNNQWLEIANRSGAAVDLGGWDFGDGISFEFPPGTMLDAGEHACIARDAAEFSAVFPGARLLGEFGGGLSRTGEHLLLRDANNNPVDEMRYFDSGRWPDGADGNGSTLELRDLDADNSIAESWAPSDETTQANWKTYSYRGVAASDGGPTTWQEFNMGMLDSGEILIDDISVIEDPDGAATQMLSNSNFESGSSAWRLRGNHRHSEVIPDPDDPGNQVLRIVATSVGEHMDNQIETTLAGGRSVTNGLTYEITFRARWVTGSSQLLTRLYFTRLARATVIDRPLHVGTPSTPNSKAETNIGPSMTDLLHSPAVPDANQAITVTARATDPDNVNSLSLKYSVNGGAFQSLPMGIGSGGKYQASIPGQNAATVIQFYLEASDGPGATSMLPAGGSDSRALIKVNDGLAASNGLHNFRVILTNADRDFMHSDIEVMSNDRLAGTIIDRETEIYYDARIRLKGSAFARDQQPRVGYNLRFGADQPYRGIHRSMAIDRSEGNGPGQFEFLFDLMIANSGGVISRYYDLIQVITPTGTTHTRPAVLQMARYDDVFLDSQFENGSDGMLFEYDYIYLPENTDSSGNKLPARTIFGGLPILDNGDDKERYRFYLMKKNNRDADDFSPIIAYCKQMSKSGAAFNDTVDEVVDVDGWLRSMAYAVLSGAGDNVAAGNGHNGIYYAHPDGRILFLPHDMDIDFSNTRSIFANWECAKLANSPSTPGNAQRKRIYFGHLHDIMTTTWNDGYMGMWQTHLSQLSPTQNWNSPNSGSFTIAERSANVLSQISDQIPALAFEISTPSPLVVASSTATVSGDGWVNVREIRIAGVSEPLDVTWIDDNSWQVTLPVGPGIQSYTLQAFDYSGVIVDGDAITIENTTTVEPASAVNLAVSELMYHPSDPTAGEISAGYTDSELFEFIELTNIGSLDVDLTGVRFIEGIVFDLPPLVIVPGERVVIARDQDAFMNRYPGAGASLVAGEYYGIGDTNKLSNGGEEVAIVDALGADIRRFTYDDQLSWPTAPDGDGPSLVLIAPMSNPDHTDPFNWRPSSLPGGNPASDDAVAFVGDPNADLDNNGMPDLLDHALATGGAPVFLPVVGGRQFEFVQDLAADDTDLVLTISTDLVNWGDGSAIFTTVTTEYLGTGGLKVTYSAPEANLPADRLFVRLEATLR